MEKWTMTLMIVADILFLYLLAGYCFATAIARTCRYDGSELPMHPAVMVLIWPFGFAVFAMCAWWDFTNWIVLSCGKRK